VTDANSNTVSAFAIHQTTGALTPVAGSPFAAGAFPTRIAINPAGTFAYVANQDSAAVTAFSIDATTGALTEISGSPFSVGGGNQPQGITVNPAGTVVYVTNSQANVAALSIDAGTGALTPVAGSPFTADVVSWGWQSLAVNPAGTFAYVGAGNGSGLLVFSIDQTTGALTQDTSATFGATGWNYSTFDGTGSTIFSANYWNLTIAVGNVDAATGHVTHKSGSPFGVGARPIDIAVVEP
jgi:6-phosphogluconolactonase (cycloisomerase 2 family)